MMQLPIFLIMSDGGMTKVVLYIASIQHNFTTLHLLPYFTHDLPTLPHVRQTCALPPNLYLSPRLLWFCLLDYKSSGLRDQKGSSKVA